MRSGIGICNGATSIGWCYSIRMRGGVRPAAERHTAGQAALRLLPLGCQALPTLTGRLRTRRYAVGAAG